MPRSLLVTVGVPCSRFSKGVQEKTFSLSLYPPSLPSSSLHCPFLPSLPPRNTPKMRHLHLLNPLCSRWFLSFYLALSTTVAVTAALLRAGVGEGTQWGSSERGLPQEEELDRPGGASEEERESLTWCRILFVTWCCILSQHHFRYPFP